MDPISFGRVIDKVHSDKNKMSPDEFDKFRANLIHNHERELAEENSYIARLVDPFSHSRPETPQESINEPETPEKGDGCQPETFEKDVDWKAEISEQDPNSDNDGEDFRFSFKKEKLSFEKPKKPDWRVTQKEKDISFSDYTEDEIAVLTYIDQYKPVATELVPELHPFVIEYMAAYGEVDSFIKVPRPDEVSSRIRHANMFMLTLSSEF